jgi:hypothetical protein
MAMIASQMYRTKPMPRSGQRRESNAPTAFPQPDPRSDCAASSTASSDSFGHGAKRLERGLVFSAGQRRQARCDHRSLVDGRVGFLEVAEQPSHGDARMPARILSRDQWRTAQSRRMIAERLSDSSQT